MSHTGLKNCFLNEFIQFSIGLGFSDFVNSIFCFLKKRRFLKKQSEQDRQDDVFFQVLNTLLP